MRFSADGSILASASNDETARLWDVASSRQRAALSGHTGHVNGVAFAPDGRRVATACSDHTVRLWDVATAKQLARFDHDAALFSVSFAPDGKVLAAGGEGRVLLLDTSTLERRTALECGVALASDRYAAIHSVEFSRDGKLLAGCNSLGYVWLWDTTRDGGFRVSAGPWSGPCFHIPFSNANRDERVFGTGMDVHTGLPRVVRQSGIGWGRARASFVHWTTAGERIG